MVAVGVEAEFDSFDLFAGATLFEFVLAIVISFVVVVVFAKTDTDSDW